MLDNGSTMWYPVSTMKKEKRITLRISDDEKRLMEQAARKEYESGSVAAWMRHAMLKEARKVLQQG